MTSTLGLLGISWAVWGCVCLLVAGIYSVVRPRPAQSGSPGAVWLQPVLRWGHAMVWVLLGGSCFLRIVDWAGTSDMANALALLALLAYALWLAAVQSRAVVDRLADPVGAHVRAHHR